MEPWGAAARSVGRTSRRRSRSCCAARGLGDLQDVDAAQVHRAPCRRRHPPIGSCATRRQVPERTGVDGGRLVTVRHAPPTALGFPGRTGRRPATIRSTLMGLVQSTGKASNSGSAEEDRRELARSARRRQRARRGPLRGVLAAPERRAEHSPDRRFPRRSRAAHRRRHRARWRTRRPPRGGLDRTRPEPRRPSVTGMPPRPDEQRTLSRDRGHGAVVRNVTGPPCGPARATDRRATLGACDLLASAAAAGGAAALADVAAAGRAHLRAAGHAERRVGGGAGDQLEQLGRGVSLLDRLRALRGDLLLRPWRSRSARSCAAPPGRRPPPRRRRRRGRAAVAGDLGGPLLGGEDAQLGARLVRAGGPAPGDGRCSPSPTGRSGCPGRRSCRPARSACW